LGVTPVLLPMLTVPLAEILMNNPVKAHTIVQADTPILELP
jgi:hypothetical protein